MDREQNSPLAPNPKVHETGGYDGPNPSGRNLTAEQFDRGMMPDDYVRMSAGTGAPVGYRLPHYSRTSPEPCRPCGGSVDDSDNGVAPGSRQGQEMRHSEMPDAPPHYFLPRNTVPPRPMGTPVGWRPGRAVEDDEFAASVRRSEEGLR